MSLQVRQCLQLSCAYATLTCANGYSPRNTAAAKLELVLSKA